MMRPLMPLFSREMYPSEQAFLNARNNYIRDMKARERESDMLLAMMIVAFVIAVGVVGVLVVVSFGWLIAGYIVGACLAYFAAVKIVARFLSWLN